MHKTVNNSQLGREMLVICRWRVIAEAEIENRRYVAINPGAEKREQEVQLVLHYSYITELTADLRWAPFTIR